MLRHAPCRFGQPVRPMGGCEEGPAWTCLFSSAIVTNVRTPIHITQSTHDCAHIKVQHALPRLRSWMALSWKILAPRLLIDADKDHVLSQRDVDR